MLVKIYKHVLKGQNEDYIQHLDTIVNIFVRFFIQIIFRVHIAIKV